MSDLDMVSGVYAKEKNPKAPDFVKFSMSIKLKDLAQYMRELKSEDPDIEWLNFQVLEAKSGKWYCKRDTWEPKKEAKKEVIDDDFPF